MRLLLLSLLILAVAGCDPLPPDSLGVPDASSSELPSPDAGTVAGPRAVLPLWKEALDAPATLAEAFDLELEHATEAIEGVVAATRGREAFLAGTLVLSDGGQPTLSAEPPDALVVRFADGRISTYAFTVAIGRWDGRGGSGGNTTALQGDHDVAYKVRHSDGAEATVHSTRTGPNVGRSMRAQRSGLRSELDVSGTESGGFDIGGSWGRRADLTLRGGTTREDWRNTFEEHRVSEMVLVNASSPLVMDVERTFTHALEVEGRRYRLDSGRKVVRRHDARSVSMLLWQGEVTRDGARVGGFSYQDEVTAEGLWRTVRLEVEGERADIDRQLVIP